MAVMSKKPRRVANPWPARFSAMRKGAGLTQAEAADMIDAPIGTWRNWEQGRRRPPPTVVKLLRLTWPGYFEDDS